MGSSLVTWDAFLKENYAPGKVPAIIYQDRVLFEMVTKDPTGGGDVAVEPLIVGNPQGVGGTLATAQAAADQTPGAGGNIRGRKWVGGWGSYSGSVSIGDLAMRASKTDEGAFLRNLKAETDGIYNAFADSIAFLMYVGAGRAICTFTISTGVCTITSQAGDIANIYEGMLLVASANDGSSAGHTLLGGTIGYVIAVNKNASTFTVSATSGGAAGTPGSWTGTMFAFRNGDFGGSGATTIMDGLGAWIPSADPSATTFNGIDRTSNMSALSGVRLTTAEIAGMGIEQRLKYLSTRMVGRNGAPGPTDIMLNPENWQALADSLESRGVRAITDGQLTTFNYKKIQLVVAGKSVNIWSDRFCPAGTAFALHMPSVVLRSVDKLPFIINGDGLEMLRKSTTNDYEHRIQAYPWFCVRAPGFCGRVGV